MSVTLIHKFKALNSNLPEIHLNLTFMFLIAN